MLGMKDKTINNTLIALHKEMTRNGLEGLPHVEALLTIRGVDLPSYPKRLPTNGQYKGRMRRMVLAAIKEGHNTPRDITLVLGPPDVSYALMYQRVYQALLRLERRGLVKRKGRVWLAP